MGFLDPAPPVAAVAPGARVVSAAFPHLPAAVDCLLPRLRGDAGDRVALPLAQRPPDRVGQLAAGPRRRLVQALDQVVAGAGAIHGDHQLAPVLRRDRGDRLIQDPQVIGDGVRPGAAGPHHPGQRLVRIVAIGQQWVMPEPFEIRFRAFLLRARGRDSRIQADADHLVQDLIGDPHPGHLPVPGDDPLPRRGPGRVHRRGDPPCGDFPAAGDLLQRPPHRRHRRDRAQHLTLPRQDSEIADHRGAVGDRHRQVRQHPAPVVQRQEPPAGQGLRQPARQAGPVSQRPQQHHTRVRHDSLTASSDIQALQPRGRVHLRSAPRTGLDNGFTSFIVPVQGHFSLLPRRQIPHPVKDQG